MYPKSQNLKFQDSVGNPNFEALMQDILKREMHIKALIQDIRECADPTETVTELNILVAENMRAMRSSIDDLEYLLMELDKDSDRKTLEKEISSYRDLHRKKQMDLRNANLIWQAKISVIEKDELFQLKNETNNSKGIRRRADKESLTKKSSVITDQLVNVRNIVANQVKLSEESLHTLVGSSSVVNETGEELKMMGGILHQSKTLLSKYGRREITTQVLHALAFIFFFTCVFYVVHKRFF